MDGFCFVASSVESSSGMPTALGGVILLSVSSSDDLQAFWFTDGMANPFWCILFFWVSILSSLNFLTERVVQTFSDLLKYLSIAFGQ